MEWQPEAPLDAILLDAPCSATGTIRRHPDLPFIKDGSEVAGLVRTLQARLRDRALGWLEAGGAAGLCDLLRCPEEGEGCSWLRHLPGTRDCGSGSPIWPG